MAILHAYDATNLSNELYNSNEIASDATGPYVKFSVPTVVNGRVYVGTQNAVAVYGVIGSIPQTPNPTFDPPGGSYAAAQSVTISEALSTSTIYYTVDGSTPTTASPVYTGPVNISGNTVLRAIATAPGYKASFVASGAYIIGGLNYVFVQGNYSTPQTSQATVAINYANPQITGDLNVIIVGWNDSTAAILNGGVTDSSGNTYMLATGPTVQSGTASQAIYFAKNIVGSTGINTVTVNFSSAARAADIRVLEYGGIDQTNPLDGSGVGATGSSASSSVAITTTSPSELLIGANLVQSFTSGPGTGFTSRFITVPDGDIAEDELASSAGTTTASAALGAGSLWVMQAVAFKTATMSSSGPAVISVSPGSGTTAGGTAVTIAGTGFVSGAAVTFGGTAASNVAVVSATQITATTPAHAVGAVTVTVTNPDTQSGSLANGYSYTSLTAPTVGSVSPGSGPIAGGTGVTIGGSNFASGAAVTFGGTAATNVVVVSATQITATTPAHAAGAVTVTVTNADTQSGSLANGFTYNGAPTVVSASPNNGTTAGGTAVTIAGTGFVSGAAVTFGGTAASNVVVVSATQITATTPAHAAGAVTVTVTNPDTQSGSLANGFTYTTAVSIGFSQVAAATPQATTQTVTVAYPGAQTVGDLNVVVVGWNDTSATVQSVTDSAGNTYNVAIGVTSGTGLRQSIYYAANIKSGSNTVTVKFSQAAAYPDIRILEYRGVSAVDVTAGASGSSTAANSGTATTTSANELIFGAATVGTGVKAAGAGFTSRIITRPDGDNAEDKTVTATGSYSAACSVAPSGTWVAQMVAFK
jgi:hypothetical protein